MNPNSKEADHLAFYKAWHISGLPQTNPASGREEDLNTGPPVYKSSPAPQSLVHAASYKHFSSFLGSGHYLTGGGGGGGGRGLLS